MDRNSNNDMLQVMIEMLDTVTRRLEQLEIRQELLAAQLKASENKATEGPETERCSFAVVKDLARRVEAIEQMHAGHDHLVVACRMPTGRLWAFRAVPVVAWREELAENPALMKITSPMRYDDAHRLAAQYEKLLAPEGGEA